MLVVHSLGVAYGSRAILADVSFKLDEGMNVLVGPAGSGKTTLLRTLAGLNIQQPQMVTWGEATLNGSALDRAAPPELVLQKERLLPLSVFECLRIGAPPGHR
ncbi:MAG: ABC transporter ATP-binding protein [Myxococcota bacterium]